MRSLDSGSLQQITFCVAEALKDRDYLKKQRDWSVTQTKTTKVAIRLKMRNTYADSYVEHITERWFIRPSRNLKYIYIYSESRL